MLARRYVSAHDAMFGMLTMRQVGVAANFINYARESAGISAAAASDRYAIGQGLFAIGRFAAAGLMMFMKPRLVLSKYFCPVQVVKFLNLSCCSS